MVALPIPISHTTLAVLDAYEAKSRTFGDSRGVPMSDAANACERAIWYRVRWASPPEKIEGLKQSRFDTGFAWEERLLDDLEMIGCTVERVDPATGKQFSVELANGWLRGKMDGTVQGLPEAPQTVHVVECKSLNDRTFKEVLKKKLKDAKPDHYAQVQLYCHSRGLTRCIYYAVNKNDDSRYAERVEYDAAFALALEAKISRIVSSDRAPARLYEDVKAKGAFACNWCPALTVCHEGAAARRNCRTCLSAEFRDGASVRCTLLNTERSYDEQQAGCPAHLFLPSLVHGEQTDASETERWVDYRMRDGEIWRDAGRTSV